MDPRFAGIARYPDPAIEVLDPDFLPLRLNAAHVELLATGFRWAEGPVWFGDHRCVLFSDIPNDRICRWDEQTGQVTDFRRPSRHSNGLARDRAGRLLACEHGSRSVTRTEPDGRITTLAARHGGRRLNSPNDLAVAPDGAVWFSDPEFGILGHYEGHPAAHELPTNLYRLDPSGTLEPVVEGLVRPNGVAFSPDARTLYVVESDPAGRRIHAFDVSADGRGLDAGRVLVECPPGQSPDGMAVDALGNLWCGWGTGPGLDGVRVFAPDGRAIGHVHLPIRCANLCFGGAARNRLFMAAGTSLFGLYVNVQGAM